MMFPKDLFDLVSARHTQINAKQIYDCLTDGGTIVIEGVDRMDCWALKELFGKGQAYNDKKAISEKDYEDLANARFSKIERVEIKVNEYYKTEEDLMALLLKTPILYDFSKKDEFLDKKLNFIDYKLFDEYIKNYKTAKGILLERVLYGIVAKKST